MRCDFFSHFLKNLNDFSFFVIFFFLRFNVRFSSLMDGGAQHKTSINITKYEYQMN